MNRTQSLILLGLIVAVAAFAIYYIAMLGSGVGRAICTDETCFTTKLAQGPVEHKIAGITFETMKEGDMVKRRVVGVAPTEALEYHNLIGTEMVCELDETQLQRMYTEIMPFLGCMVEADYAICCTGNLADELSTIAFGVNQRAFKTTLAAVNSPAASVSPGIGPGVGLGVGPGFGRGPGPGPGRPGGPAGPGPGAVPPGPSGGGPPGGAGGGGGAGPGAGGSGAGAGAAGASGSNIIRAFEVETPQGDIYIPFTPQSNIVSECDRYCYDKYERQII